jgi:hypothetical protein
MVCQQVSDYPSKFTVWAVRISWAAAGNEAGLLVRWYPLELGR